MKRIISLFLAIIMVLSLCACGAGNGTSGQETAADGEQASENSAIEVDEGLLSVEITMPATFFEEETPEDILAAAEENGIEDCTINEDGSVTYKMSKAKHREMMAELKASWDETIEELISGEEAVKSFRKIEYADDFSEFDVYVDPEIYSALDSLYVLVFYMTGAYYQAFDGKDMDEIDVVVNFINNTTNEVIESGSFRDWVDSEEAVS